MGQRVNSRFLFIVVSFSAFNEILQVFGKPRTASPDMYILGSCHKRQKPQAPIRNRQTRKVANAKGLNRNTNLTKPNLT